MWNNFVLEAVSHDLLGFFLVNVCLTYVYCLVSLFFCFLPQDCLTSWLLKVKQ